MFTQIEWHVLNTLDWTIGHPTVDGFLQLTLTEDSEGFADIEVEHMAWYICEIALYHREFVSTKPSVMARAALALARGVLNRPQISDGAWNHAENLTLVNLSHHLHQPSQVLSRKYASAQMSRVSVSLEHFLARQTAINSCPAPQTPPCEPSQSKAVVNQDSIYNTPHKGANGVMVNGYLTPPITPEGHFFLNGSGAKAYQMPVPGRPITPTPSSNDPFAQQHYQSYHQGMMQ
jgi:hypothetical protein